MGLICFFLDHKWDSPEWLSKVSIENPTGENRRRCVRCGKIETIPYYPTIKEQMQAILNGEDEETDLEELVFDEDDEIMPEAQAAMNELGLRVQNGVVLRPNEKLVKTSPVRHQSCGDDGICRTGPGATFWYD